MGQLFTTHTTYFVAQSMSTQLKRIREEPVGAEKSKETEEESSRKRHKPS